MKWDRDDDKPREKCGVFGVFGHPEASLLTALGLHALQHRGQEACGIATFDGGRFHNERHLGLVGDHFVGEDMMVRLPGSLAIGHNRYSTTGTTVLRNVQPLFADTAFGGIAIAHNGNLTNARAIYRRLVKTGSIYQSTMDSEAVLQLVARSPFAEVVDRMIDAIRQIEGGYAIIAMTDRHLIGVRDPVGLKPLVLGRLGTGYILASETCALDIIGAEFIREVDNGEMIVITEKGVQSLRVFPPRPAALCAFEYVYFSRPDSIVQGRSVYEVRRRMGRRLAEETPVGADVVVPVPDSGVPAAIGFSERSGIPFQLGIIRSHYVHRTFIEPAQIDRDLAIAKKHSPNRAVLEGRRVILVDDSIVRGSTSRKIVKMVREAGAREVHFRSASPPITHPDFYGIDLAERSELLAADHTLAEMEAELNVDSLGYLSIDGLYDAIGGLRRDADRPQFSDHCFTGDYPTPLTDHSACASEKDFQLSLLDET